MTCTLWLACFPWLVSNTQCYLPSLLSARFFDWLLAPLKYGSLQSFALRWRCQAVTRSCQIFSVESRHRWIDNGIGISGSTPLSRYRLPWLYSCDLRTDFHSDFLTTLLRVFCATLRAGWTAGASTSVKGSFGVSLPGLVLQWISATPSLLS